MRFLAKIIVLLCAALAFGLQHCSTVAADKLVMVYYMPWFEAKPFSEKWGWHWTMDHFNPDLIDPSGERQVASWYHPLIGPYDSADPAVLEYHVLLMKLAGIDGVIVDWYGNANHLDYAANNTRTLALLQIIRKAGMKFALCYEDRTVLQQITDGVLSSSNAIAHAQQTMLYLQSNYFGSPAYITWSNRPVLLNFGPQYFKTGQQWETIFSVLDATNRPAFFKEDNYVSGGTGAFNWPPMWLSVSPGARGVLSMTALDHYLTTFEQSAAAWPAYISSAFPRFHDVYQPAGVRDYWGYLGDRKGDTFRFTLTRALTNHAFMAQVVTWNDFSEGTVVEPTVEYGFRDLGIIQDCRRQYLSPSFPYRTNDLALASQLFQLRRAADTNAAAHAELDSVFTNIINGDLAAARRKLQPAGSKKRELSVDGTAPQQ